MLETRSRRHALRRSRIALRFRWEIGLWGGMDSSQKPTNPRSTGQRRYGGKDAAVPNQARKALVFRAHARMTVEGAVGARQRGAGTGRTIMPRVAALASRRVCLVERAVWRGEPPRRARGHCNGAETVGRRAIEHDALRGGGRPQSRAVGRCRAGWRCIEHGHRSVGVSSDELHDGMEFGPMTHKAYDSYSL